jgi:probable rRNA maturation factor
MTTARPAARRLIVSVSGRTVPAAARGLGSWLAGAAPRGAHGTVDIALVSDAQMRRLNRTWRHVDKATDVLSFPVDDIGPEGAPGQPAAADSRLQPLGDIAMALGIAARQATDQGHSLRTELRVLALHGLLHLLGYDHERDQGQMRRTEERLRRRAGLPSGLIARVPGTKRP